MTKNAQEMVAGWEEESSPFCWCSKAAGKQGVGGVQPMYEPLLMKTSRETVKNVPPKNTKICPKIPRIVSPSFTDAARHRRNRRNPATPDCWVITWIEIDTLPFLLLVPRSFSDVLFDAFVMCYLMHIKCLFSHPLMGALAYSSGSSWETGEGEGAYCFTISKIS